MALGAQARQVRRPVVRETRAILLIGVALGMGGAAFLGRVIQSVLFEMDPGDPANYAGGPFVMIAIAVAAAYVPTRRALAVDPMVALRME